MKELILWMKLPLMMRHVITALELAQAWTATV
jgi:hypothetical protein